ncbi:hypothetical protein P5G62_004050 [Neobacillus sp. 179-C4.2 HS]|uniref:YpzI family protein n=1 Tax=Neobacillus driksii TaxID=3035913 RepID=A0ABV4YNL5_9BACI
MKKKHLGQSRQPGVTEEHEKKAFGSKQAAWSDRNQIRTRERSLYQDS